MKLSKRTTVVLAICLGVLFQFFLMLLDLGATLVFIYIPLLLLWIPKRTRVKFYRYPQNSTPILFMLVGVMIEPLAIIYDIVSGQNLATLVNLLEMSAIPAIPMSFIALLAAIFILGKKRVQEQTYHPK